MLSFRRPDKRSAIGHHCRMAADALSGLQLNPCSLSVGPISAAPSGITAGWRLTPYPADKAQAG
ncbi:hypothetical protein EH164_14510 [Kosakonia sp. CCTCC M2018092]|nr:hypothetical protein EH164_14510 [Kosakonia sp. CCTCC M2018092]